VRCVRTVMCAFQWNAHICKLFLVVTCLAVSLRSLYCSNATYVALLALFVSWTSLSYLHVTGLRVSSLSLSRRTLRYVALFSFFVSVLCFSCLDVTCLLVPCLSLPCTRPIPYLTPNRQSHPNPY
jgi:hypothetical protein